MTKSNNLDRRDFLRVGGALGLTCLLPATISCVKSGSTPSGEMPTSEELKAVAHENAELDTPNPLAVPKTRPESWDPIAFNKARGNAGAIPESYLPSINGEDGVEKHLGKHLPFIPKLDASVPGGMLALMFGDPSLGYAKHPNAVPSEKNPDGHWYNWIRVRVATEGEAEEKESQFTGWPNTVEGDSGAYAAKDGSDPAAEEGKNTVYLVALPSDAKPGDWIRVYGHCLTHGEYVDFIQLPA